jgi:hypothetical protein
MHPQHILRNAPDAREEALSHPVAQEAEARKSHVVVLAALAIVLATHSVRVVNKNVAMAILAGVNVL